MAALSTDTDSNGQISNELITGAPPADANLKTEDAEAAKEQGGDDSMANKWPGWPGHNVFRLVVPVLKVGSIIGKKGELIKKLCEETKAKVRILDGAPGTPDRIVVISGKEEPEAEVSPAMEAVLRVFKRVNGVSGADGLGQVPSSVRLLMPSSQAINLIGKQGSSIKSIQETTGALIRVLTGDELPYYADAAEERVVDIQGDYTKVLKALEAVVGHLRKFLVDHSVLPLFDKSPNTPLPVQALEHATEPWNDKAQSLIHAAQQSTISSEYTPLSRDRDSLFLEHDPLFDSQIHRPELSSLYRTEPPLSGLHSTGLGRGTNALVTQVTQTMQIPLSYAEDIIGIRGATIAYIRQTSGAVLTVQESSRDEITVEIKGTSNQVKIAEQLIQDFVATKEPAASSYGGYETGLRSSYSHLDGPLYASSSLTSHTYSGGYGPPSGLGGGGYGSYRI